MKTTATTTTGIHHLHHIFDEYFCCGSLKTLNVFFLLLHYVCYNYRCACSTPSFALKYGLRAKRISFSPEHNK